MGIAENIKRRRLELGLSQQELADKMGYKTRSTITKIESGENTVSEFKVAKFANALDTTVEFLKTGIINAHAIHRHNLQNQSKQRTVAIILAGGKSTRNMQNIPNQFINVLGKPVIIYSLEAYQNHPIIDDIYIVCLKGWEGILTAYAEEYKIDKLREIIPAGETGILSVKNGVTHLYNYSADDRVILQESTRPLVTEEIISKTLHSLENGNECVVVAEDMSDFIQFTKGEKSKYLERDNMVSIQSPEAYKLGVLRSAFQKADFNKCKMNETTCAMMMHNLGYNLFFCEGNHNNIKVVRQEDIAILNALIKQKNI